jgi:hypothetical protein
VEIIRTTELELQSPASVTFIRRVRPPQSRSIEYANTRHYWGGPIEVPNPVVEFTHLVDIGWDPSAMSNAVKHRYGGKAWFRIANVRTRNLVELVAACEIGSDAEWERALISARERYGCPMRTSRAGVMRVTFS